ncbi:GTPase [Azohydromonas aeria]|uniref:GTPase n=1 Tax=Azohydromonas aeria TaxID=2590212 RepID=UPI0012FC9DA2|nr:GTPase [Azohydromonas aeria]
MRAEESYNQALHQCKKIAKTELSVVVEHLERCDDSIEQLKSSLSSIVREGVSTFSKEKLVQDGLATMVEQLNIDHARLLEQRHASIRKHKNCLSYFNVMLFGRTMAGKSTLREALTGGDGSTIGRGAQRTTRDVREYVWNDLRVIDTPGFGAFEGGEDTAMAREILEQSDVVLFLLNSDGIQESTFNELVHVHRLNKPLIFLLNIKKDLSNEGTRRRALKNPEKYVYKEEDIAEHIGRLRFLATRAGMQPDIKVIHIHAQAAFLATQESGEMAAELHTLSRIGHLIDALRIEVETRGAIRRVQTFLDSALFQIEQQDQLLHEQRDRMRSLLQNYESILNRVRRWKSKLLHDLPATMADLVDKAFKPLQDSVSDFVDNHVENANAESAWNAHVKQYKVQESIQDATCELVERVMDELRDFNQALEDSITIGMGLDALHPGGSFSEFDYKRINGWGSAIAGVLSAIAFYNAWNPVGWIAAGASLLFGIFSWLSDSRNRKLNEAKLKQRKELEKQLNQQKLKIRKNLEDWFDNKITRATLVPAEANLISLCIALTKFLNSVEQTKDQLLSVEHELNSRLLHRVAALVMKRHFALPSMSRIVRSRGYACYFSTHAYFRDGELLRQIGDALNEDIKVIYEGSIENKVMHLYRGLIERVENIGNNVVKIFVSKEKLGKVYGKDHRKIKMVAGICRVEIRPIAL